MPGAAIYVRVEIGADVDEQRAALRAIHRETGISHHAHFSAIWLIQTSVDTQNRPLIDG